MTSELNDIKKIINFIHNIQTYANSNLPTPKNLLEMNEAEIDCFLKKYVSETRVDIPILPKPRMKHRVINHRRFLLSNVSPNQIYESSLSVVNSNTNVKSGFSIVKKTRR